MEAEAGGHRIRSIRVIGGFLDGVTFELSQGLNCIIGARGTGKTTVLELVRFALDALPASDVDPGSRRRIESLIQQNLAGGRVELTIETRDGLIYTVTRAAGEDPIVLDADGQATEITLKTGGFFGADIFSQNEVEAIADQATSQLDLIDNFEVEQIAGIEHRIRTLKADLDSNASKITPLQQKVDAFAEELGAIPGLNDKLKAFKTEGGDDAKAINDAHNTKSLRDREGRAASAATDHLRETYRAIEGNVGRIGQRLQAVFTDDMLKGPNGAMIEEMRLGIQTCGEDVDRLLHQALERIRTEGESVTARAAKLDLVHKQQELKFQELLAKHKEAQGQAAERQRLEKQKNALMAKQREREQLIEQLKALREERAGLLQRLSELRDERFAVPRQMWASQPSR
jgi:DNA repair ATPase RecN